LSHTQNTTTHKKFSYY